ncbi:RDD family protein [Dokdonella sp.]|uniref:RDD family protein n=1 Tax=Dokdonella sp. TaxID=2291710 RepID=UPI003267A957
MENSSYALVLTGTVLPSHTPETVWPALAAYFRMDVGKLVGQLLARAPLTVKQGDDLGKLQTLLEGAAAVGAQAEICAPDGRPGMFVMLENKPRGPVPRVYVDERVDEGVWPSSLVVAEVGASVWKPYSEFVAPVAAPVAVPPPPEVVPDPFAARDIGTRATAPSSHLPVAGGAAGTVALPASAAVEAGFWRRCAACLMDSVVIAILLSLVTVGAVAFITRSGSGTALTVPGGLAVYALQIVIVWLYYALQEGAPAQATLGKRAMGIKVTDDYARRIGFGRATGRYFGKIISGLVFNIGFLLVGWTARKQGLHDMMAGTLVVFDGVESGQPLPTVRPPMPWYGWLVNVLFVGSLVLAVFVLTFYLGVLVQWIQASLG